MKWALLLLAWRSIDSMAVTSIPMETQELCVAAKVMLDKNSPRSLATFCLEVAK